MMMMIMTMLSSEDAEDAEDDGTRPASNFTYIIIIFAVCCHRHHHHHLEREREEGKMTRGEFLAPLSTSLSLSLSLRNIIVVVLLSLSLPSPNHIQYYTVCYTTNTVVLICQCVVVYGEAEGSPLHWCTTLPSESLGGQDSIGRERREERAEAEGSTAILPSELEAKIASGERRERREKERARGGE